MTQLTPELIYKDLYASAYKDLIKYVLTEDLASCKASIYAVKHTWYCFSSKHSEAFAYRDMLDHITNGPQYLSSKQIMDLLKSASKDLLCK